MGHICQIRSCPPRDVHANHRPGGWYRYIGLHHGAGAGGLPVSGRRHAVRHDHGGHALQTWDLNCNRHHDGHDHGEIAA